MSSIFFSSIFSVTSYETQEMISDSELPLHKKVGLAALAMTQSFSMDGAVRNCSLVPCENAGTGAGNIFSKIVFIL